MPDQDLYGILKENGYNPYSMPDRDFVPLAVVRQNAKKKFERVGMLPEFIAFPDNVPKPPDPAALPPENKPEFSSVATAQIDASLGASLLRNIFAQMGETSASTKIKFDKVNKIELSYTNVVSDCVDPVKIAKYLQTPAMPPADDIVAGMLEPDNTFVIYDTLKSDAFTVKCHAKEEADAKTEVSVIKDVIRTDGTINIREESDTALSFRGPGFQTFALRIYPFWITKDDSGKKKFFFRSKPRSWLEQLGISKGPARGTDASDGKSYVLQTGAFYRFD